MYVCAYILLVAPPPVCGCSASASVCSQCHWQPAVRATVWVYAQRLCASSGFACCASHTRCQLECACGANGTVPLPVAVAVALHGMSFVEQTVIFVNRESSEARTTGSLAVAVPVAHWQQCLGQWQLCTASSGTGSLIDWQAAARTMSRPRLSAGTGSCFKWHRHSGTGTGSPARGAQLRCALRLPLPLAVALWQARPSGGLRLRAGGNASKQYSTQHTTRTTQSGWWHCSGSGSGIQPGPATGTLSECQGTPTRSPGVIGSGEST